MIKSAREPTFPTAFSLALAYVAEPYIHTPTPVPKTFVQLDEPPTVG